MQVQKRNGSFEEVSFDKILRRITYQAEGLNDKFISVVDISKQVVLGLVDGISTKQLDILAAEVAASLTVNHPDYSILAARIAISNLYKETENKFSSYILKFNQSNIDILDYYLVNIISKYADLIDSKIDHNRDKLFDYFGFKTLEKSYLLKDKQKVVERPQYMWMRVSLGIWGDNLEQAFKTYDLMSNGYFTHATPTLFNSGTKKPQLSSCFLIANKGDSLDEIMDTCKDVAKISASAGGIGIHVHNLRASGSYIYKTGGTSKGLLPLLKTYNELARWWDQGGNKRKGSFAIYLEPWHRDIEILLDIRKNTGKDELRARDLFTALWIPDLFMRRVESNSDWTLFCPNEILLKTGKSLQDVYGEDFDDLYKHLETLDIGTKIPARDLWQKIIESQIETGNPYMLYKDACNSKSNQKNLGVIKSSNLCAEIIEFSSPKEIAVCNLASIALPKFVKEDKTYDYDKLIEITRQLVSNLNRVININYYPTPETNNSNYEHRPIGIGVQGLADTFALMKYDFDSIEAKELNKNIFETIYYAALLESCEIAQKTGSPYNSFKGSPASKGILQFDMWGVTPSDRYNWSELKEDIKKHGLINSLLIALMPTASTGQILGNTECFEPFNSNISTRNVLAGTFPIINKHLIRDLEELGLWSMEMKNKLIAANGSIQSIFEIPLEIKKRYKTVYEISQKTIIELAADRGAYICQSQSMNLFIHNPNTAKLTSMHFYSWKKGLKTGMYYLRAKAAVDAIKFTIEQTTKNIYCSIDNKDNCENCSA